MEFFLQIFFRFGAGQFPFKLSCKNGFKIVNVAFGAEISFWICNFCCHKSEDLIRGDKR